jgi:hypothetical protein
VTTVGARGPSVTGGEEVSDGGWGMDAAEARAKEAMSSIEAVRLPEGTT